MVELRWSTASELNNAFFTIEKAAGIEQFHIVGEQIDGQGTVNLRTDYVTKDENPFYGRSYYRLKQTDYDGTFTFSPVVAIDYEISGLKTSTLVPVHIYNMQGQKIFDHEFEITTPGTLRRRVDFETTLGCGLYIIKAGPTLNLTKKVAVE